MAGNVFRAYDVRGVVGKDFDEDWVRNLGRACGVYFLQRNISDAIIGYDCRNSSPLFHKALVEGLLKSGISVVSVGMVPTPALYFAVKHLQRKAGVMITASHNPAEYNGFKIWCGESTIYAQDLQEVRTIFEAGNFMEGSGLYSELDIIPSYIQAICDRTSLNRPLKIVVDGGNGSGGEICCQVLEKLGANVIPMFCKPDGNFPNHHPDPVVEANMQLLIERVVAEQADLGIGLDGDADRLGVVDRTGRLLNGDELLSIYGEELLKRKPGSVIIGDVKCSQRLFDSIAAFGGQPLMWTTGHSVIKAKMREVGSPLAGEMSGHMFFVDNWYGFDDGIYGSARLVDILSRHTLDLQNLPQWPTAFATREINWPYHDEGKFALIAKAQEHFSQLYPTNTLDGARIDFGDGFGLVRASNTQPALVLRFEAKSRQRLEEIQNLIFDWLKAN